MSEYQYYEFAAVDRPLTPGEQAELRERSTRARITPSSFVNEYHWGDLKGDPVDWVERYFDAHVYSANWGSCRLLLRLPRVALDRNLLQDFSCTSSRSGHATAFAAHATTAHWILDWSLDDDSGENERFWGEDDGSGWMGRLLPLRDELLRGDIRPLYLGWLSRACRGELDGEALEPPVPAGLQTLTPAQSALAEFLLIDPDWLAAAAEASPTLDRSDADEDAIDAWLAGQTGEEMRAVMRLLLQGRGQEAEHGLHTRFLAWQRARRAPEAAPVRRAVAGIEAGREAAASRRQQREAREREARQAKQQAERTELLSRIAAHADEFWLAIDASLQRGSGAAYDEALKSLQALAEALALAGRKAEFRRGLVRLMSSHGKRTAWVVRLKRAGLMPGD
ncbi:hypothetical protein [Caldimonas tepidiphila]|uniref:hypothetical protein n=1 Tax=Caldimonas tepidiphila TaxID=2315841 RepID=UPI000E5B5344|nr:hypothetical protein [Caldimonas tepidiphila]